MKNTDVTAMQPRWVKFLVQAATTKLRGRQIQFLPDVGIEIGRLHAMVLEDQQEARKKLRDSQMARRLTSKNIQGILSSTANQCSSGLAEQRKLSTLVVGRPKAKKVSS